MSGVVPGSTVRVMSAELSDNGRVPAVDVAAVVAHGLLGSMSVVAGAAHMLEHYGEALTSQERLDIIRRMSRHADHVMGILGDVARGMHPEVHDVLDHVADTAWDRVTPGGRPTPG